MVKFIKLIEKPIIRCNFQYSKYKCIIYTHLHILILFKAVF